MNSKKEKLLEKIQNVDLVFKKITKFLLFFLLRVVEVAIGCFIANFIIILLLSKGA